MEQLDRYFDTGKKYSIYIELLNTIHNVWYRIICFGIILFPKQNIV